LSGRSVAGAAARTSVTTASTTPFTTSRTTTFTTSRTTTFTASRVTHHVITTLTTSIATESHNHLRTPSKETRVPTMKISNLSMPSVLAMSLLVGCAVQPGDEQGELDADQAAQAGADGEVLDARAAVAAETKDMSALTSQAMQLTTWYSG